MFKLACGDVMPGCPARFETTDRDLLLSQVAATPPTPTASPTSPRSVRQAIEAKIAS